MFDKDIVVTLPIAKVYDLDQDYDNFRMISVPNMDTRGVDYLKIITQK